MGIRGAVTIRSVPTRQVPRIRCADVKGSDVKRQVHKPLSSLLLPTLSGGVSQFLSDLFTIRPKFTAVVLWLDKLWFC